MIYTLDEIKKRVIPVAVKYGLRSVYIFGSYARGEATESSDVDLLVDRAGSSVKSLFDMGGLYEDLRSSVGKEIDLVTLQSLEQESTRQRAPWFAESVRREMRVLYE